MKILIEATLNYRNMGDLAMLQVCLRRLRSIWPDARFVTFTFDEERLANVCPGAIGIPAEARNLWFARYRNFGSLSKIIPARYQTLAALWRALVDKSDKVSSDFISTLRDIDLFVISGMGSFHDAGGQPAMNMLETIALMKLLGIPSIAFSQGIGPIDRSSTVWPAARRCLPCLDLIALREGRTGPALLQQLGVPLDRIKITGDDAIVSAYRESGPSLSNLLGVNLRVAFYSAITEDQAHRLSKMISRLATTLGAALTALPCSHVPGESDLQTFTRIFPGLQTRALSSGFQMTPEWIIEETGRCRVVIAGSYHTAVFALSQGIPTICLALSQYYQDKFLGLAAQFGPGCHVVRLDKGYEAALVQAATQMWRTSDSHRKSLLSAARAQIKAAERTWNQASALICYRRRGKLRAGSQIRDGPGRSYPES